MVLVTRKWRRAGRPRARGLRPRPRPTGPSRTARRGGVRPAGTPRRFRGPRGRDGPRPRPPRPRTRAAGRRGRVPARTPRPPPRPRTRDDATTVCAPATARPVPVWPRSARTARPWPGPSVAAALEPKATGGNERNTFARNDVARGERLAGPADRPPTGRSRTRYRPFTPANVPKPQNVSISGKRRYLSKVSGFVRKQFNRQTTTVIGTTVLENVKTIRQKRVIVDGTRPRRDEPKWHSTPAPPPLGNTRLSVGITIYYKS